MAGRRKQRSPGRSERQGLGVNHVSFFRYAGYLLVCIIRTELVVQGIDIIGSCAPKPVICENCTGPSGVPWPRYLIGRIIIVPYDILGSLV